MAKRRLDLALAKVREDPSISSKVSFTVKFLPYQLYPSFPADPGEDKYVWTRDNKYQGSDEKMAMYVALMQSYGDPVGIKYKFTGTIANTLPAHRVLQYFQQAKGPETADRLVESLYKAYFEDEKSPSSDETLVSACVEAGISQDEAKRVVQDHSEGLAECKEALQEQASNGVDSVPYVIIEGKRRDFTLIGAKEVEEYAKALASVAKESY